MSVPDPLTTEWVPIWSAQGVQHVIQDEGVQVSPQRSVLNFVGAGVAVTDDSANARTLITIAGGSAVSSVFSRTGTVVAASGDYTAAQVTNAVSVLGSYADPAWISSLAWAKITGAPAAVTQTPWTSNIDAASFNLGSVGKLGVGIAASSAYPLRVDVPSNVGITSPILFSMHAFYGATGNPEFVIKDDNASSGAIQEFQNDDGHTFSLGLLGSSFGAYAFLKAGSGSDLSITSGANKDIYFTATSERMRIQGSTGRVGIGQTSPGYKLDVAGDVNISTGSVYRVNGVAIPSFADPTTTKGDIIGRATAAPATRLGVGSDGQVLTADAASTLGVKWATAAGGAGVGPIVICYNTAGYPNTFTQYTWQPVLFDTNQFDTSSGAMHSQTTNSERFVAPSTGYYVLSATLSTNNGAPFHMAAGLNGSTTNVILGASAVTTGATGQPCQFTTFIHLNANDYVTLLMYIQGANDYPVNGNTYEGSATVQFVKLL